MVESMIPIQGPHAWRHGLVLLLVFSFGIGAFGVPAVHAQLPVYGLEGVVYDENLKPLAGATVSLKPAAGGADKTATTDASGKYSIGSLTSGQYNATASHKCCADFLIPITVSGTDAVVNQNFKLSSRDRPDSDRVVTLRGTTLGEKDRSPVAGVLIEVWNYFDGSTDSGSSIRAPGGSQYFTTTSGPDGGYSLDLNAGTASLTARKDGYDLLHAGLEMRDNRSLDLPMRKAEGERVTIFGTVTGSDGKAPAAAYVNLWPDYSCPPDADCVQPMPMGVSSASGDSGSDANFWYESSANGYASTTTDKEGRYEMTTTPGRITVSANADGYLQKQANAQAESGARKQIDFVLERIPADSVKVFGTVLDAKTGNPIPFAQISLENQKWGQYNGTQTGEDGAYELYTKPGYVILTISASEFYGPPCLYAESKADDDTGLSIARPCYGEPQKRDADYLPRVQTFEAAEDDARQVDAKLVPRPAPDALLEGYVVNASSQTAVPGVQVSFYNDLTRDWGSATTDENGSYKIKVHAGYYTIRTYAEHYYDQALNAEIKSGEEQRLDLFVTPGERNYYCCFAYGQAEMAPAKSDASASGGGPPIGAPSPGMATQTTSAADEFAPEGGQEVYRGEAGGLGPYKPEGTDGGRSPAPAGAWLVAALAMALGFVAWRRR